MMGTEALGILGRRGRTAALFLAAVAGLGVGVSGAAPLEGAGAEGQEACTPGNGGIELPDGFCAVVFHEGVGPARHLVVAPNGDVFVARPNTRSSRGSIVALRDSDGDGVADVEERFGDTGGNGILLHEGFLYFAPDDRILRYPYREGSLTPGGAAEVVISGLPATQNHRAKSLAILDGRLYVNIGSPSNACQRESRTQGSPGRDPCPELETRAGVWRFDLDRSGQTRADGTRFATGLRNTVALNVNPATNSLFGVVHGRDQLSSLWPEHFDEQDSAEKPGEEFVLLTEGADFGWPYCFYDPIEHVKVLAPEYGGDGREVGRCAAKSDPIEAFPGHWAPNDLVFYTGSAFPEPYRGGAFIAFHGSWNRAPLPQGGYKIVFVPMDGDRVSGEWRVFADGFAGGQVDPRRARFRPVGLDVGPDGALYVSDSREGRIWKIVPREG